MNDDKEQQPESLLPYDEWTETALRQVMVRAVNHVAEHGLPGAHHFYITFRTDHPHAVIPPRMRAQYPQEMTIVLQHQFWDLKVDEGAGELSVGLSFGGIPTTLHIPLGAVTGFADPQVQFGLRFKPQLPAEEPATPQPVVAALAAPPEPEPEPEKPEPQVVSLDAFRRRPQPKE
jgi:uncharacterized protein